MTFKPVLHPGTFAKAHRLTKEEERELLVQAQTSTSPRARDQAITRLVNSVVLIVWRDALRLARSVGVRPADVFQDGVVGVVLAIAKCSPDRETRFSTYACTAARHQMTNTLARTLHVVRRTSCVTSRELFYKLHVMDEKGQVKKGRVPTDQEIAEQTGKSTTTINRVRAQLGAREVSVPPVLPSPAMDASELYETQELRAHVRRLVKSMPPEHQKLVRRKWLADPDTKREGTEAAMAAIGCCEARAYVLEREALQWLRAHWTKNYGEAEFD